MMEDKNSQVPLRKILLAFVLVFLLAGPAFAGSLVWKVSQGDRVLYLGGTIHLLRPSDFPLPKEFQKAYRDSDRLVFETDIGKLNDPALQEELRAKALYIDGSTLAQHLSAGTYRLLSDYCAANSIPIEALEPLKPSIVAVTLETLELAKHGVAKSGVDMYFYHLAKKDGKPVSWLESVDEQLDLLVGMGEGEEDDFVRYTLDDLKNLREEYGAMVEAWEKGKANELAAMIIADMKKGSPRIYRKFFVDRNRRWLPKIEAYLRTAPREFVLVGAGHLVGPDGLVAELRKAGYRVEKL